MTISALLHEDFSTPTRFGFIITKRVGVAVVRNRMRRRLKAITAGMLEEVPTGVDVIIRVHPEAVALDFAALEAGARSAIARAVKRAERENRRRRSDRPAVLSTSTPTSGAEPNRA